MFCPIIMINRIHCVLLLLLCLSLSARAQMAPNEKAYADSLLNLIQHNSSDSVNARLHYLLSDYWRTKDTLRSRQYLDEGRRLAARYPLLTVLGDFYEGWLYFFTDQAKAAELFTKAERGFSRFKQPEAYEFRAASWYNYSLMKKTEKGDAFVIDILLNKAIPLSERGNNKEKTAHFYSQLATALMYNQQFDKAAIYNKKAIGLLEGHYPQSSALVLAYLSATSNYMYSMKSQEAKVMLDKAAAILKGHPESVNYPLYYYNEGTYYGMKEQYPQSMASLEKGISGARQMKQAMLLQMLIFRKYNILQQQQKFGEAQQFLVAVSKDSLMMSDANNQRTIYGQLSQLNAQLGDMGAAYKWLTAHNRVDDSLNKAQVTLKINTLETKFRSVENEKKIAQLEAANKLAMLSASNNRLAAWLSGAASFILLIVAAFSIYYYRSNKKLSAQKEINHQQQLKEIAQQQELVAIKAMMDGEEKERERVARDLHDGLGGLLAGIKMDLSKLGNSVKVDVPVQEQLHASTRQLDGSIQELRRIARNMMPESLLRFGLETALKDFCEGLESEDTTIVLQCYGMEQHSLQAHVQLTVYRIVQELVTNALKHAHATRILVDCIQDKDLVSITVEDNGRGFDPRAVKSNGSGLSNVKARVNHLKGTLDIQVAEHAGTSINIQFNEQSASHLSFTG